MSYNTRTLGRTWGTRIPSTPTPRGIWHGPRRAHDSVSNDSWAASKKGSVVQTQEDEREGGRGGPQAQRKNFVQSGALQIISARILCAALTSSRRRRWPRPGSLASSPWAGRPPPSGPWAGSDPPCLFFDSWRACAATRAGISVPVCREQRGTPVACVRACVVVVVVVGACACACACAWHRSEVMSARVPPWKWREGGREGEGCVRSVAHEASHAPCA